MAGCAVMAGPHRQNAAEAYAGLAAAGGLVDVADAESMARQVAAWLDAPDTLAAVAGAAQTHAQAQGAPLDAVVARLRDALEL